MASVSTGDQLPILNLAAIMDRVQKNKPEWPYSKLVIVEQNYRQFWLRRKKTGRGDPEYLQDDDYRCRLA